MKTIKIARIGGEFMNSEEEVSDYINPYTGKPSNTWREFAEAKKLFDSLDFKNISKQEGGYLPEYRMTKAQMEAQIAYQFEDGYKPFLYLFSFEIPLSIWANRERYAKESGYDDAMEYITDFTNYNWVTEEEKEIRIPKKVIDKYTTTEKTKYSLYHKSFKGSVFQIMVVSGKHNYVSVTKKTNNPFGGKIGKDFDNFNEAAKHYKSPEMKTFILQVEMGLLNPDHVQEI